MPSGIDGATICEVRGDPIAIATQVCLVKWTIVDHSGPLLSIRSTIAFHCSNDIQSGQRFPFSVKVKRPAWPSLLKGLFESSVFKESLLSASPTFHRDRHLTARIRKLDFQDLIL